MTRDHVIQVLPANLSDHIMCIVTKRLQQDHAVYTEKYKNENVLNFLLPVSRRRNLKGSLDRGDRTRRAVFYFAALYLGNCVR